MADVDLQRDGPRVQGQESTHARGIRSGLLLAAFGLALGFAFSLLSTSSSWAAPTAPSCAGKTAQACANAAAAAGFTSFVVDQEPTGWFAGGSNPQPGFSGWCDGCVSAAGVDGSPDQSPAPGATAALEFAFGYGVPDVVCDPSQAPGGSCESRWGANYPGQLQPTFYSPPPPP